MGNDKPTRPTSDGTPAVQQKDWFKKLEAASGQPLELNTQRAWVYLTLDCSGSMEGDKPYSAMIAILMK